MVVVEPPKIWKMKPKMSKKPLNERARPTPRTIPRTIETITMERISNNTRRMIWLGDAPMACRTASSSVGSTRGRGRRSWRPRRRRLRPRTGARETGRTENQSTVALHVFVGARPVDHGRDPCIGRDLRGKRLEYVAFHRRRDDPGGGLYRLALPDERSTNLHR